MRRWKLSLSAAFRWGLERENGTVWRLFYFSYWGQKRVSDWGDQLVVKKSKNSLFLATTACCCFYSSHVFWQTLGVFWQTLGIGKGKKLFYFLFFASKNCVFGVIITFSWVIHPLNDIGNAAKSTNKKMSCSPKTFFFCSKSSFQSWLYCSIFP